MSEQSDPTQPEEEPEEEGAVELESEDDGDDTEAVEEE